MREGHDIPSVTRTREGGGCSLLIVVVGKNVARPQSRPGGARSQSPVGIDSANKKGALDRAPSHVCNRS